MKTKKRYLFVWEGIWTDYYSGIVFALAENLNDAHEEVRKFLGPPLSDMQEERLNEIKQTLPTIVDVTENYANGISGGG